MSLLHPGITAFQAIARLGTVHAAAQEIGLSQTGVTQRIRGLERDLGVTLFVRSRRGMRLTTEGEALVRWCQRVGDLEGELISFMGREAPAGAVRVSSSPSMRPARSSALSHRAVNSSAEAGSSASSSSMAMPSSDRALRDGFASKAGAQPASRAAAAAADTAVKRNFTGSISDPWIARTANENARHEHGGHYDFAL